MGGIVAAAGPMDETMVKEAPDDEIVYSPPLAEESLVETTWES